MATTPPGRPSKLLLLHGDDDESALDNPRKERPSLGVVGRHALRIVGVGHRIRRAKCKAMGARMLCYFSSQYEDWRPDAGDFGQLGAALDDWAGEKGVNPNDPANLAVMIARLDIAVDRGCEGIDLDSIDHSGHESYVMKIFDAARSKGLLVSQKNAVEKIGVFWDKVDMYQNEQCQQYGECEAYEGLGRPVYNIEYSSCKVIPYLYSNRKHVDSMDAWEGACSP